jgi:hypothetical protein
MNWDLQVGSYNIIDIHIFCDERTEIFIITTKGSSRAVLCLDLEPA